MVRLEKVFIIYRRFLILPIAFTFIIVVRHVQIELSKCVKYLNFKRRSQCAFVALERINIPSRCRAQKVSAVIDCHAQLVNRVTGVINVGNSAINSPDPIHPDK